MMHLLSHSSPFPPNSRIQDHRKSAVQTLHYPSFAADQHCKSIILRRQLCINYIEGASWPCAIKA
ncbi:hypothetical protein SLEP1_g37870 [Rubroshorea leprosula]|uniref:Uncharacterized protein n=1 Tax=Rubroshorea leprosula TaxID=152421 RepID=A0AAV5KW37_9ROSI|nr:hypothetical protein SLEP1_g37870 [Rubroshorea leprosula]